MTPDQERWAEALMIERLHGPRAADWIAERIATLAAAGDRRGVERFEAIAWRRDSLTVKRWPLSSPDPARRDDTERH